MSLLILSLHLTLSRPISPHLYLVSISLLSRFYVSRRLACLCYLQLPAPDMRKRWDWKGRTKGKLHKQHSHSNILFNTILLLFIFSRVLFDIPLTDILFFIYKGFDSGRRCPIRSSGREQRSLWTRVGHR